MHLQLALYHIISSKIAHVSVVFHLLAGAADGSSEENCDEPEWGGRAVCSREDWRLGDAVPPGPVGATSRRRLLSLVAPGSSAYILERSGPQEEEVRRRIWRVGTRDGAILGQWQAGVLFFPLSFSSLLFSTVCFFAKGRVHDVLHVVKNDAVATWPPCLTAIAGSPDHDVTAGSAPPTQPRLVSVQTALCCTCVDRKDNPDLLVSREL